MISLDGDSLTLDELVAIADDAPVALATGARARVARRARRRRSTRATATRRSTASTPASASSPRRASTTPISPRCSSTCCAATPPASASRCRCARVRATMALRANVLAKGFSGIRVETLDAADRAAQSRRASASCRPAARSAPAATSRRSRTSRSCSSAKARPGTTAAREPARRRCARAGLTPVALGAEGRAGAHQRHAGLDGGRSALALAGAEQLARAADIAAALSIDALHGSIQPFDARIHDARGRSPARRRRPPTSARCSTAARINASHANCGRVQDAYSMRCAPQVHGAARDALRLRASDVVDDRGQRRHRQPDGVRRHRRDRLGRQLPRRAGRARRRSAGDRARAAGDDQRAALRSAGQPGAQRAAGVPHPRTAACSRG